MGMKHPPSIGPGDGQYDDRKRRLLTARELAALLGVTSSTVRRWARSGRVPCLRAGHRFIRFEREAALRALSMESGSSSKGVNRGN